MTLGQEFRDLVVELLTEQDGFGSLMRWRHYVAVDDPTTGDQGLELDSEEAFIGAIVDPARTKLFGDATLAVASTAVLVPPEQLSAVPRMLDQVEIQPARWLRVIELKELFGPGGAGSPVLVAYVAALGA
jgi:hypothetical protein